MHGMPRSVDVLVRRLSSKLVIPKGFLDVIFTVISRHCTCIFSVMALTVSSISMLACLL